MTECTCYCEYPNKNHLMSSGRWKCVDKYECVRPLEEIDLGLPFPRVIRKTKCVKKGTEIMTNTNREFKNGEKIHCKSWQDLRTTALCLSSKGYGVAVIGFSDMSDDILTVTEVPEVKE